LEDQTVTVRFRDTMEQIRISVGELPALVNETVALSTQLAKL
jgi:glycyl-tRNA synthetase (class II)